MIHETLLLELPSSEQELLPHMKDAVAKRYSSVLVSLVPSPPKPLALVSGFKGNWSVGGGHL